jgi:methylated-DNA-[protein]-cysteine S-methyltransferase
MTAAVGLPPGQQLLLASPVGTIRLESDGEALTGLHFPDPLLTAPATPPGASVVIELPAGDGVPAVLTAAARQIAEYFAGDRLEFDLPVSTGGTAFQQRVWAALLTIPYGVTTSYGRLAADGLGDPKATRALGLANGRNPVSLVVPCHRVIGAGGKLIGYGGGLERKRWLLAHEAAVLVRRGGSDRLF